MSKGRILVVEDEVIISMEIEGTLRGLGYEVTSVVNTGDKAVMKAEADKPDLILMDIRIQGDKDGIETAEIIRSRFGIPVVFSTAYLDEERIERAKITMPFGYVLKPIQERDLRITLEMALYVAKVDAERRQTEMALSRSEELLNSTGEMARVGGWEVNLDANTVYWSQATKLIHEVPLDYEPAIEEAMQFFPGESRKRIESAVNEAINRGISYELELDFITAKGNELKVKTKGISQYENGRCLRLYGTFQDITELKQAEAETIELKEFYEEISERAEDGIWVTDSNDLIIYFNPGMERISGLQASDAIGLSVTEDFPEETIQHFIRLYENAKTTLVPRRYEAAVVTPAGRSTIQSGWLVPRVKNGVFNGMICTIQDVTERKQLEQEQAETLQQLHATVKAIPDLMFEVDRDGRVFSFHIPEGQVPYAPPETFLGKSIRDVLPGNATDVILSAIAEAGKKGSHVGATYSLDLPDGRRWYELSIAAKGSISDPDCRFIVLARDFTERRKSEEKLRISESRFQLAMDATSDGLFDLHIKTNEIYFSPGYFTMLGYEPDELPHAFETYEKLLHPEGAARAAENLNRFLSGEISENSIEIRFKAKSGDWIWVLSRGSIVERDENGNPTRMVGTNVNINDRKQVEERLRYEKELSSQYLDVARVLLVALDANGYVTRINPKGCEILGYDQEEIVGYNWFDKFLPAEGIEEVKQVFDQIIAGDIEPVEYYENKVSRKDGSQRHVAWHNSVLRDEQGEIIGVFSSGEDLTGRQTDFQSTQGNAGESGEHA